MQIENINKKINKIRDLIFKIFERLNIQFEEPPTITNMANFLQTHQYISEIYSNKLKSLDKLADFGSIKQVNNEVNDVELYLLTKFYHYI